MAVLAGVAVLVAVGGALALGGRSEDESCGGSGYPDTPECVARAFATRTDASRCELVAPALLEQLTGARGPEARRRCATRARSTPPAKEVEVLERESEGGDEVVVELLLDGREGSVTLTEAQGRWQITTFAE